MKLHAYRKLNNRYGTTLAETLATIILLGLMGVALVGGISAVQRAYQTVVRKANEQVLLSTTLTEMRDLLRHTQDYRKVGNEWYFQHDDGYWFRFYNAKEDDKNTGVAVMYYYLNSSEELTPDGGDRVYYLVPVSNGDVSGVYSSISDDTFSVENESAYPVILKIKNLKVGNDTDEIVLDEYKVAVFKKTNGGA